MGCQRGPRPSEETFNVIWSEIRNLCNCVWHGKGLKRDAKEISENIKKQLDKMIIQMEDEE